MVRYMHMHMYSSYKLRITHKKPIGTRTMARHITCTCNYIVQIYLIIHTHTCTCTHTSVKMHNRRGMVWAGSVAISKLCMDSLHSHIKEEFILKAWRANMPYKPVWRVIFRGVLIFVIFVVDLAVTKFISTKTNTFTVTVSTSTHGSY